MAKKARKLSVFEIIWYSITGLLGAWGLTYVVFGIIVRNQGSNGALYGANATIANNFGLGGFFNWGLILVAIAVVLSVIVLLANAKKTDTEFEKNQRRAARLAAVEASKADVIDAE